MPNAEALTAAFVAYVRAYRRLGERVLDVTMVTSYQFVDGAVRRANDMCPPAFGEYWAALGLAS